MISREIDYSSANIIIYSSLYTYNHLYISAQIDGVKYDNKDIDDLVKEGIIDVKYYLTENNRLSAYEYLNHEYHEGAEIIVSCASDTVIKDDSVYAFIPKRINLPTIDERYNFDDVKTRVYSKK